MKYVKKFFSMLFEDLHWKLLALFAASILWFLGMNMNDPYQNHTVSPRLQLENIHIMASEGIVVLNEDALRDINVSVVVRGLRSDMEKLRAAMADPVLLSDFIEASVDFRAINSEAVSAADGVSSQSLTISVNLHSGLEHLSIKPKQVEVSLDTAHRQLFPVQTVQYGDVPPGFELQHIRPATEHVNIRGARSDLRMVSLVQAIVDITGVHEDAELVIPFRVIDINGEEMTADRVRLNVTETTVNIRVWQIRSVNIRLRGSGSPASGYALAEISRDLTSVDIVGPEDILNEIEYITVEMGLSGASTNITQTIELSDWLPEGVILRQGEPTELTATARIEPIEERVFSIPRGNVRSRSVIGRYELVNENAQIRVTVSGPRSVIAALSANDIELELDLRSLPIGIHTVPLLVELPLGLTLVGSAPTLVVQIFEPAAQNGDDIEPTPEPTEPPTEEGEITETENELPQGALDDEEELINS